MKPSEILRELKKLPNKVLGQNFLVDDSVSRDMILAADIKATDTIVEIGPGLGSLTFPLANIAGRVIAIEADRELASYLRLKKLKHVNIVTGDALKIDWTISVKGAYKIVSNIPYSITSPLLRKIFSLDKKPLKVLLLVQKEMAERICAAPGSSERGFLTLITEANALPRIIRRVKPGSFYPSPKTDSAIIELTPREKSLTETIFWPAVEAGFRHRRQILANCLNKDLNLDKSLLFALFEQIGLLPTCRAQELSFESWQKLSKELKIELN